MGLYCRIKLGKLTALYITPMKNLILIKLTAAIKVYPCTFYKQEKSYNNAITNFYRREIIAAMIHETLPTYAL